jgi:DNA-binding HxlR family transcriptional regulator
VANRSYDQYCPIAGALDVLGERWTLLILRELLLGPRRFTDLRQALPGLAPNLLAERLRTLEDQGLVAQEELPPPAARSVYVATADATAVIPVLRALGRFGMRRLPEPVEGSVRPSMAVWGALGSQFDPLAAVDVDVTVAIELDGERFDLAVRDGRLRQGSAASAADVTVTGSPAALVEVCQGRLTLAEAARQGRLAVEGGAAARRVLAAAFHLDAG